MDQDTERLHEAREDIDRALQRLETVEPSTSEVEGTDARKAVRVRVAPDGRVGAITVDHRWQDLLTPAELGPAIAQAYVSAGAGRLEDWNEKVEGAFELPEPANRPFPTAVAEHVGGLPSATTLDQDDVLRELLEVWTELEAQLDAAIEDVTAGVERVHRASSPNGDVNVELSAAGGLLGLTLREAWATRTHPANIGRTVLATIEQAQGEALSTFARTRADADRNTATLTRLGDPTRIGRRLGLDL
ncbi:hypothetical protein [Oryzobacter telluris]|uniref:hypothetical protein n=1 Tax=Oryzobacter telluris TaxID=3149179 RepID=UPI00370D4C29